MKYDIYLGVAGENPCDPSVGMEIQPPLETTVAKGLSAALGKRIGGAEVRITRNDSEGTAFVVDTPAELTRNLSAEQLGSYVFGIASDLIDPCSLHTVESHLTRIEQ